MRRLLGCGAIVLAVVLLSACQVKVPGLRQSANPCTTLGRGKLAHLAHARGTVVQKPLTIFTQGQVCEFKANAGTPVLILGTFDAQHLSFDSEVAKLSDRYQASGTRQVKVPGATDAATMLATFSNARVPVLVAEHDGFISLAIVITKVPARAAGIERASMAALVRS